MKIDLSTDELKLIVAALVRCSIHGWNDPEAERLKDRLMKEKTR